LNPDEVTNLERVSRNFITWNPFSFAYLNKELINIQ
jgi:hypothetical protein